MIAKCITSEKQGRKIFYGAMIGESVIALIWAAAGVAFYGATQVLNDALKSGPSDVVYQISTGVLGATGSILAIAGVIVCPITSGDTAFRSARLILAEIFHKSSLIHSLVINLYSLIAVQKLFTVLADNRSCNLIAMLQNKASQLPSVLGTRSYENHTL
jgi:carbon starvation protein CstA